VASVITPEPWALMSLLPPECAAESALAGSENTRVVRSLVEAVSVALDETDGGTAPPFATSRSKHPILPMCVASRWVVERSNQRPPAATTC